MPDPIGRYITVQEARVRYHVGQTAIYAALRDGYLTRLRRPGDRRTLMDREQADRHFMEAHPVEARKGGRPKGTKMS